MHILLSFWRSTVGKKVVMASTGVILVAYIVSHVLANLLVYVGPQAINGYGALLHSTGGLLWVARAILLAAFLLHVTAAAQLTRQARAARPSGYAAFEPQAATLAARSIRWGGVALLLFIVAHTLQMTVGVWHPRFVAGDDYHNVVRLFQVWWMIPPYLLALGALALHLYHGTWSMWRTLGVSRPSRAPQQRPIAVALAVAIALGFTIIPLGVAAGVLREQPVVAGR